MPPLAGLWDIWVGVVMVSTNMSLPPDSGGPAAYRSSPLHAPHKDCCFILTAHFQRSLILPFYFLIYPVFCIILAFFTPILHIPPATHLSSTRRKPQRRSLITDFLLILSTHHETEVSYTSLSLPARLFDRQTIG